MLVASRAVQGVAAGGLMTLAMAAVGDLVAPRERGRYQGYIAATFAVATVAGPLIGGLLVEHASWRWVFYVNLPLGVAALAGLRRGCPRAATGAPRPRPLDVLGAALLAGATSALMLACIWGGDRYAWDSAEIVGLVAGAVAFARRARRARAARRRPDRPARACCARAWSRSRARRSSSATAALFAITVFVPLFLQTTTGATPTEAGLLLVPAMLGITRVDERSPGARSRRPGRYKRFPLLGLALMTAALVLLALARRPPVAGDHGRRPGRVRARLRHGRARC